MDQADSDLKNLCAPCAIALPTIDIATCLFCGSPSAHGKTCSPCRKDHFVDQSYAFAPYSEPIIRKIIKTLKYRFVDSAAEDIADLIFSDIRNSFELPHSIVTSVPLHIRRYRQRGFNQAELIAQRFAKQVDLTYQELLIKTTPTKPQADFENKIERFTNLDNVFEIKNAPPKHVILIDDVTTTGTTLDQCAKILKQNGTEHVSTVTFAKG